MNGRDVATADATSGSLVVRSVVEPNRAYKEYWPILRKDFFCSCAYCTMTEAEATAIRFTIDHYEPQSARPDLVNSYDNLMYCCDECNIRKGDLVPPPKARENGVRYFRPDQDKHTDHFQLNGIRLQSKTVIGEFSIDAIDLNRLSLRTLRSIRHRLTRCDEFIAAGVLALRQFHIDQLPPDVKRRAAHTINRAIAAANSMAERIDALLEDFARSPLLDVDPDGEALAKDRRAKIADWKLTYPGEWRSRSSKSGGPKRRKK